MSRLPTLPAAELRRFTGNRRSLVALIAIVLVPLIYGGLYTWANQSPQTRLDQLTGAVVNLDQPVTLTHPDGTKQLVPLGRSLTGKLTTSTSPSNFHWVLADAPSAADGLASGRYAAVLTIPAGFSAAAASTAGDPALAESARVRIETDDAVNYLSGTLGTSIATAASAQLARELTSSYLTALYDGTATLKDQLGQAATGAGDLSTGAATLADGTARSGTGAQRLASGVASLAEGADTLAAGAAALATGSGQAAGGAAALSSGLARLDTATSTLPTQTRRLAEGASAAASGVSAVSAGAAALATGTAAVSDGAGQLAAGVAPLVSGADAFTTGAAQLSAGATQFAAGAATFAGSVGPLATGAAQSATGAAALSTGVASYTGSLDVLAASCPGSGAAPAFCAGLQQLAAQSGELRTGAASAAAGAAQVADGVSGLQSGATRLGSSAASLGTAATDLASGATSLGDGVSKFAAGLARLAAGAQRSAAGAADLAAGAAKAADGTSTLATGADQLADGIPAVSAGIHQSAAGALALATKLPALTSGASKVSTGSASLATGAYQAAGGASRLADGLDQLDSGATRLASGAQDLGDGLREGVAKIPSYTDTEKKQLAAAASAPVLADAVRLNPVKDNGSGLAPYFAALALWVGSMAIYLLLRPLSARALASSASATRVALAGYLPGALLGALQGIALALLLQYAVGISAASVGALIALAALAGLTFTAMNQALVALFGTPGRFLAVILAGLQLTSAGGTYAVQTAPVVFQWLHGVLPLTYAVDAFRHVIAGSGLGVGHDVVVLLLWLAGGLCVSVLAARRQRTWTLARLHPRVAV